MWPAGNTGAIAKDIPNPINPDVGQPGLLERRLHRLCASRLMEWRRRDLAETNLIANDLRLVCLHGVDRGSHVTLREQIRHVIGGSRRLDGGQTDKKYELDRVIPAREHSTNRSANPNNRRIIQASE